jgi:hypothetical protein
VTDPDTMMIKMKKIRENQKNSDDIHHKKPHNTSFIAIVKTTHLSITVQQRHHGFTRNCINEKET